ncbi:MAG: ComEC/Rec2 family competence protein [Pseudomonadota bacterium]
MCAALITGKRQAIPDEAETALRDAGLAHVLAISGMHMGLVAGLIYFLVRRLKSSPPQRRQGPRRDCGQAPLRRFVHWAPQQGCAKHLPNPGAPWVVEARPGSIFRPPRQVGAPPTLRSQRTGHDRRRTDRDAFRSLANGLSPYRGRAHGPVQLALCARARRTVSP